MPTPTIESVIDLPYLSFTATPLEPTVDNRCNFQNSERIRVYFMKRKFMIAVNNRRNRKFGYTNAKGVIHMIRSKHRDIDTVPLHVVFPTTWSDQKINKLYDLMKTHVTNENFDKTIYKYLLLLM